MPVAEAIRSWKDEDFLMTLSEEQKGLLPENPAGSAGQDLSDGRDGEMGFIFTFQKPHCLETNVIFCTRKPIC